MKALCFLLSLAVCGLGGWAWWEHAQRTRLEGELVEVSTDRDKLRDRTREITGLQLGLESKKEGPEGLGDLLPKTEKSETAKRSLRGPGESEKAGTGGGEGEASMAKMLKDPAMREMQKAQMDAQLELAYRDLFDLMGLDDTKRDAVLAVLKQRQLAHTDLGLSVFDKDRTLEERKASADKLSETTKETERQLKELLGDNFSKFDRYEKSTAERDQIKMFDSMLKDKGLTLDEATESKLMDAMFAERQNFKFDRDLTDMTKVAPDNLSGPVVDRFLEETTALSQKVLSKAKEILPSDQYEIFVKAQENQLQMAQLGFQWIRQMTGAGQGQDGTD